MADGFADLGEGLADEFLGGGFDVEAMASVVDPELYRNRREKILQAEANR